MLQINKKDLIKPLQNSKLGRTFEDKVVVPKQYLVTQQELNDLTISNFSIECWSKTLNKLRYWMVDELPHSILKYVQDNYSHINKEDIDKLINYFYDFSLVKDIQIIYDYSKRKNNPKFLDYENKIDTINLAIKNNSIALISLVGNCEKFNIDFFGCTTWQFKNIKIFA